MKSQPYRKISKPAFVITFCFGILFLCPVSLRSQQTAPARSFRLEALTPKFHKLIDAGAQLKTVSSGFGFTEGPVWDKQDFLWVSDEVQNKIYKVFPDGRKVPVISLGDPDGNTYDQNARLIDCASVLRAIIRLSPDGSTYTILADRYQGKRFNSPNDVVPGPDHAFYFTDPTLDLPKGQQQELPFQGVFRLDASGHVTLLTHDQMQPNGLAFSPDGKRFYVDDSQTMDIWVYEFADGKIYNGHIFGRELGEPGSGVPDGMRLDKKGNLFVVGPGGIWVWTSKGVHIGTILLPQQPANLAWGGPHNSTLYITATHSVYKLQTKTRGFTPYR